jgi:Uma2 family endonuclease
MQLLGPASRSQGWRTFGGNRLLRTSPDAAYHPDLMVVCRSAADVHYEDDATLIVEVLSQSTRAIDRREKLEAYRRLRSLRMYLLVEPTIRRFEVATFAGESKDISWEVYGPGAVQVTPYIVLYLDTVYDVIDGDATT